MLQFMRRVRGESRLYCSRLVVIIVIIQVAVVAASLLVGQDYASEQIAIAESKTVNTCRELSQMGVPRTDCRKTQANQRYSGDQINKIADRIGPPAESSSSPLGVVGLTFGHSGTLVGLAGLALIATVVLGGEAEAGLAASRDRHYLGRSSFSVRAITLALVWLMLNTVVSGTVLLIGWWASIDVGWDGAADFRSTSAFVIRRIIGGLIVAATFAFALIALRRVASTRARWFLMSVTLLVVFVVLAGTERALLPPWNAGWAIQQYEQDLMSYIDRYPLSLGISAPSVSSSALVVGATIVFAAVLAISFVGRTMPPPRLK